MFKEIVLTSSTEVGMLNANDQKKGSLLSQVLPAVLIALIAGGTAPWWYNKWFSKQTAESEPASIQVSHDFMIGRWQSRDDQSVIMDLSESGKVEGTENETADSVNGAAHFSGTWDFEKLSNRHFVLWLTFASVHDKTTKLDTHNDPPERWEFEVSDRNHIRTIDSHRVVFERLP